MSYKLTVKESLDKRLKKLSKEDKEMLRIVTLLDFDHHDNIYKG